MDCKRFKNDKTFCEKDGKSYSEPLVDAFGVELVRARKHSEQLPGLEVAHADHAGSLVALVRIRVELVAEQLVDLQLGQSARLGFAQTFCKIQQRFIVLGLRGVRAAQVRLVERRQRRVGEHRPKVFIMLNLTVNALKIQH